MISPAQLLSGLFATGPEAPALRVAEQKDITADLRAVSAARAADAPEGAPQAAQTPDVTQPVTAIGASTFAELLRAQEQAGRQAGNAGNMSAPILKGGAPFLVLDNAPTQSGLSLSDKIGAYHRRRDDLYAQSREIMDAMNFLPRGQAFVGKNVQVATREAGGLFHADLYVNGQLERSVSFSADNEVAKSAVSGYMERANPVEAMLASAGSAGGPESSLRDKAYDVILNGMSADDEDEEAAGDDPGRSLAQDLAAPKPASDNG